MGLFGFLRRKDEAAMPEPGSPEFERMVSGSALPGSEGLHMGEGGWSAVGDSERIDLRGSGARDEVVEVLRQHGIDPERQGQTIDASKVPGLRSALIKVLLGAGVRLPDTDGFAGGVSPPKRDD